MTLRFILGPAGAGKTHACISQMAELITADPLGFPLLLLTPQQSIFIYEKRLAAACPGGGYCRAEVSGFARLAQKALRRQGGEQLPGLSEAGQLLAMSYAVSRRAALLRVFGPSCRRAGFAREMVSAAEELRAYGVSPQALRQAGEELAAADANSHSAARLQDIALLAAAYEEAVAGRYCGYAERMDVLAQQIEQGMLAGAEIWMDGFSAFTPAEQKVLLALAGNCRRVSICLCLDTAALGRSVREDEVFYPTWKTWGELNEAAAARGIPVEPPLALGRTGTGRFRDCAELDAVERSLAGTKALPPVSRPRHIHLSCGTDARSELESVGRRIRRLVREKGWRYRDISVICRDTAGYEYLLQPVFGGLDLPYFLDSHKPLLSHPLIDLVRAALEIWTERPGYRQIMRFLKNPLSGLSREESDLMDDYCLAHGVKFYHWPLESWRFTPLEGEAPELAEQIEDIRRRGWQPLRAFLDSAGSGRTDAVTLNRGLGELLETLQVRPALRRLQELDLAAGRGEEASAHVQAWDKLTAFLDEAAALLGQESYSPDELRELYDTALQGLTFATIPPGLDQVLVASLERSRNPEIKAAFIIGVNEGLLPASLPPEGAFRDEERQWLAERGLRLAPDRTRRQLQENYLCYIALTRPAQELYLSYHLHDDEGKRLAPSPLLRKLTALYPELTAGPAACGLADIAACPADLELAASRLRQDDGVLWRAVVRLYGQRQGEAGQASAQVERGLSFAPTAGRLQPATVRRLYGSRLRSSVSQIERFRCCPFSYFATYGLGLKPRRTYELTPADRGDLFHFVLADVGRSLARQRISWQQVDRQLAELLVEQSLTAYLPRFLAGIMTSSARYAYLEGRIRRALVLAVLLTAEHMKQGKFVPVAFELPFGRGQDGLPALNIRLEDGRELQLAGQIDRVDLAEAPDGSAAYLRVVDYKTGAKKLRREDIAAGLQLQLLAYLQVVLDNTSFFTPLAARPAGVYYARVQDEVALDDDGRGTLEGLKLQGVTVPSPEVARLSDGEVNGWSSLVNLYCSDKGSLRTGLAEGELEQLRELVVSLLKDSAAAMLDGLVAVSPLVDDEHEPCGYCDFAAACAFEREAARPRRLRDGLPGREDGSNG